MVGRPESLLGGTAGLAKLAIEDLRQAINTHRVLNKMIKMATTPILSLDWGKPLIRAIGPKTIDELLRDLLIAGITSGEYGELVSKLKNTSSKRSYNLQNDGIFGPSAQRNTN